MRAGDSVFFFCLLGCHHVVKQTCKRHETILIHHRLVLHPVVLFDPTMMGEAGLDLSVRQDVTASNCSLLVRRSRVGKPRVAVVYNEREDFRRRTINVSTRYSYIVR